jgi:hypothetical protein
VRVFNGDVGEAYKRLDIRLARNKVRYELKRTERHEKKGAKRRRLTSERWRMRFADEVRYAFLSTRAKNERFSCLTLAGSEENSPGESYSPPRSMIGRRVSSIHNHALHFLNVSIPYISHSERQIPRCREAYDCDDRTRGRVIANTKATIA